MSNFNKDITKLTPSDLVNDKNANAAPSELQENIEYILNFLNGNKALLSGVFGNLWDYNQDGKRVLYNGGKFDTFAKCNTWDALNSLRVENETEIIYDEGNERCVYVGQSGLVTNREKWIEREVWIPEVLRDQNLYFSIKASGCNDSTDWDEDNAVFETIAIQILGAEEDIQEFRTVGVWEAQPWYSNDSYGAPMTTVHVPFKVSKNTRSVKIKVFRTRNSGFLHIDKVFVGGIASPYDNEIESYQLDRMDINELFDYENSITKVISTAVMGHKVPEQFSKIKGPDLVTYEYLIKFLQQWVSNSATCNLVNIQGTYIVAPNSTSNIYTISHSNITGDDTPIVTLVVPDDENDEPTIIAREWVPIATGTHGLSGTSISYDDSTCWSFDDIMKSVVNPGECNDEDYPGLITIVGDTHIGYSFDACTSGSSGVGSSGTSGMGTSGTSGISACPFEYYDFETGFYKDIIDQTTKKAIKIIGIANLEDGKFDVVLSESPTEDGYAINWSVDTKILCDTASTTGTTGTGTSGTSGTGTSGTSGTGTSGTSGTSGSPGLPTIGNYFHPEVALQNLVVPVTDIPDPNVYIDLFGFQN